MIFTTITETNFSVFRLVQGGSSYWLQKFDDHGLEQMELSEVELVTMLEALPTCILGRAVAMAQKREYLERHRGNYSISVPPKDDNNPFFHLGEQ